MTTKRGRAEFIERLSREMAQSGNYRDYTHIEMALRAQGFEEARGQLDNLDLHRIPSNSNVLNRRYTKFAPPRATGFAQASPLYFESYVLPAAARWIRTRDIPSRTA